MSFFRLAFLSWLVLNGVVSNSIIRTMTGAVFIFIANASPNRASLGATNGLSQVGIRRSSFIAVCI